MPTKRILELIGLEGKRYESQNSRFAFAGDNLGSGLKAAGREGHGTESQLPVKICAQARQSHLGKVCIEC
jgi:hypothetical protein